MKDCSHVIYELVGLINGFNFIEYFFGMEKKMNEKYSSASRLLKKRAVIVPLLRMMSQSALD